MKIFAVLAGFVLAVPAPAQTVEADPSPTAADAGQSSTAPDAGQSSATLDADQSTTAVETDPSATTSDVGQSATAAEAGPSSAMAEAAMSSAIADDPQPPATAEIAQSAALAEAAMSSAVAALQPGSAGAEQDANASEAVLRVADWIATSRDNGALPYIIVDKNDASLFLFDAEGQLLGKWPVLIGVAVGDDASPGIGSKSLAEIGPAEKTTPAGRFLAKYGPAAGTENVLWVDYDTSVALHPIPPGASKKEHRRQRMLSPTPDDNRITFGCINVPLALYDRMVRPLFQQDGGYVYVLPDTRPLEEVFPSLVVQHLADAGAAQ